MFVEILKTIVLGIIEGITEWLPISSTGHLIIADEFLKLGVSAEFKEMFEVVIQLGAIMAVIVLYFNKLWPFKKNRETSKLSVKPDTIALWIKVIVATVPAAIVGFLLDDWMNAHLYNVWVVSAALIIYGVLFIILENHNKYKEFRIKRLDSIDLKTAFLIGLFQILPLIPGTSRSGSTILGAMILGCSRTVSAEFSFFMAIPVMFGASFLKLMKFGFAFTGTEAVILAVGMIVSFVVSVFAIRFLIGYIKKRDFKAFGYYRIILGALVLILVLTGVSSM